MHLGVPRTGAFASFVIAVAVVATLFSHFPAVRAVLFGLPLVALVVLVVQPASVGLSRRMPLLLVLFVAWSAISFLWTADRYSSLRSLADLLAVAVIATTCGPLLTFEDLHRVLSRVYRWIVVATFVTLIVAPRWSTNPAVDGAPGWHGLFSHKNGLGAFAVIALVTLWLDGRLRHRRLWALAVLVLVIGSQSSTALALVLLCVAALTWNRALASIDAPAQRVGYLGFSIALAATSIAVFSRQLDLVTSLLGRGASFSGRTDIWSSAWRAFGDQPLRGYGYGGVWSNPLPPTSEMWKELRFEAFHAHNGFLDLALQVGVVGLGLFLLVLGAIWWRSVPHGSAGGWARAILAVLVANATVESGPFFGGGMLLVALFAAVAAQRLEATDEISASGTATPRARRLASNSR